MKARNMTNHEKRHVMKPVQQPSVLFPRNNEGFTLIEALLAMFVFTFGVLAVMTMTINANNGFTKSRTNNTEVNRTTLNLETLKEVGYNNANIFQGAQVSPMGKDGATVDYNDADDAIVAETKLITIQNTKIKGGGATGNYVVYYTKPLIEN